MNDLHKEINFETEICDYLAAHGWLYAEGDTQGYDRALALFPADVVAWVQSTQPKAWDALGKNHGTQTADVVLGRLRDSIDQRGTLDVLRRGVEMLGLRQPLALAQFKPALAMNPEFFSGTPKIGCASSASCVIRCIMRIRLIWFFSSTVFRSLRLS